MHKIGSFSLIIVYSLFCVGFFTSCGGGSARKLFPQSSELSVQTTQENYTIKNVQEAKLDILFVIDDSASMLLHQETLSRNIDLFLDKFSVRSDIKVKAAVVTSSGSVQEDGRSGGGMFVGKAPSQVVENNSIYFYDLLKSRILVGAQGSGREMFFYPIKSALWGDASLLPGQTGFLREDAFLAIVILTDADDQSPVQYMGETTAQDQVYEVESFVNDLAELKSSQLSRISTIGIVIPSGKGECTRDVLQPVRIEKFLRLTNGTLLDLCSDFGPKLANVGSDLYEKVRNRIYLSDIPYVPSIKLVFETGEEVSKSFWSYNPDQNSIELDGIPQEKSGLKISIEYKPATR